MSGISVIIPAYQAEKTLGACLESLAQQTLRPHEVIVVDDGSTDGTQSLAARAGSMVRVIATPHGGAAQARNAGAAQASGDLLFFCDADVIMQSDAFAKLSHVLTTHPEASFSYSAFRWGKKLFHAKPFNVSQLHRYNSISTMSLIRKKDFPGFDVSLERFQDWDLWLTMAEQEKTGVPVPDVLFSVQLGGRMSQRGGLSRLRATRIIRKKHHLSPHILDGLLALRESLGI